MTMRVGIEFVYIRVRFKYTTSEVKLWKDASMVRLYLGELLAGSNGVKDILIRPCSEAEYVRHTRGGD